MRVAINVIVENEEQAKKLIEFAFAEGMATDGDEPAPKPVKGKKSKKVEEEIEEDFLDSDEPAEVEEEETEDVGLGEEEEETEEEAEDPPPKKKAAKATKLSEKDVNAAALKHAKKHGRPKTLALLKKKFGVQSILELKPDKYSAVIAALKV